MDSPNSSFLIFEKAKTYIDSWTLTIKGDLMRDFLDQIRQALAMNLYYVALIASLTVPDICGAIGSANGKATKSKYIDWFDRYVASKYVGTLTGEDCYYYRCSALHQGSSQHPHSTYSRIIFVEPSATTNIFHCNILNDALNIDVRIFCNDIVSGAMDWLKQYETTKRYERNYSKFMRRYPSGLSPYIVGVPIIS